MSSNFLVHTLTKKILAFRLRKHKYTALMALARLVKNNGKSVYKPKFALGIVMPSAQNDD